MTQLANLTTYISGESASFVSAINESRGGLRSLISSLDPVAAATAKYNRQVDLLDRSLRQNKITVEQHALVTQRLTQRYQAQVAGQTAVTTSVRAQRAGMQQLSYQIGDVATQFASGTKPMIIFAQQGGQVLQAIQLMSNGAKGFIGFLAGPWGQIITAAIIVLTSLYNSFSDNADAANKAADGVDNYTDALKRLRDQGGQFSFSSPEFTKVSKSVLEAEAKVAQIRQQLTNPKLAQTSGPTFSTIYGPVQTQVGKSRQSLEGDLDRAITDAQNKRAELNALLLQQRNRDVFDAEKTKKPKKTSDAAAMRAERLAQRFDNEIAQLKDEQRGLLSQITTDVREQARLAHERVDAEVEAYKTELEHRVARKEITDEQAKELLTAKEANAARQNTLINWKLDDQLTEQELSLTRSRLDNANELLGAELENADTAKDRRRIQLAILDNEAELERASLEAIKAKHASTDVEYKIAQQKLDQLDAEKSRRATQINRSTMGPMEQYLSSLPDTADKLKEKFESIKVDALNNSLDLASQNVLKLKGFAGQLFNQLIADVIRLQLQSALAGGSGLLGSLGKLLGLGGSLANVGGFSTAAGLRSAGASIGANLPKFANGGSFPVGGLPGIDQNVLSINGIPRAMVSGSERVHVANDRGGPAVRLIVSAEEGALFRPVIRAESGAVAGATFAEGNRVAGKRASRRLA